MFYLTLPLRGVIGMILLDILCDSHEHGPRLSLFPVLSDRIQWLPLPLLQGIINPGVEPKSPALQVDSSSEHRASCCHPQIGPVFPAFWTKFLNSFLSMACNFCKETPV